MYLARMVKGKNFKIFSVKPPFSFYKFVEENFHGNIPINRIFGLARLHNVKTIIIEEIPRSNDIKSEDGDIKIVTSALASKFEKSQVTRLSFFNEEIKNPRRLQSCREDAFIGYIIIKKNLFTNDQDGYFHVFESVMRPRPIPNLYIHTINNFRVKILERTFPIAGSAYFQQNSLTTFCAHTTLATHLSSILPNSIFQPFRINRVLKINFSKKEQKNKKGLTAEETERVLKTQGHRKFGFDLDEPFPKGVTTNFARYLYSSVESGFPALLGFKMKIPTTGGVVHNHIVPVIGHTFDKDTWVPNAEKEYFKFGRIKYLPSDIWADSLVIHDDNFGSYYCLPLRYISPKNLRLFFGTLPAEILSDPLEIEPIAQKTLHKLIVPIRKEFDLAKYEWLRRLVIYEKINKIVLRTKLQTKSEYIYCLLNSQDWDGNEFDTNFLIHCLDELPDKFWQTEISIPELFSIHLRKLGDIILKCDLKVAKKPTILKDLFLLARFPELYIARSMWGIKADFYSTKVPGHIPIFI